MAVFDPNDWWSPDGAWFVARDPKDRRRAREANRTVLLRWLVAVSFCLCFASLGPNHLIANGFITLLVVAALASLVVAIMRREHPFSPHLTAWDEALLSLLVAIGLTLWLGTPG